MKDRKELGETDIFLASRFISKIGIRNAFCATPKMKKEGFEGRYSQCTSAEYAKLGRLFHNMNHTEKNSEPEEEGKRIITDPSEEVRLNKFVRIDRAIKENYPTLNSSINSNFNFSSAPQKYFAGRKKMIFPEMTDFDDLQNGHTPEDEELKYSFGEKIPPESALLCEPVLLSNRKPRQTKEAIQTRQNRNTKRYQDEIL